ncbi:MAG: hypothetical protein JXA60_08550 [Candidatus Coatesbacteria bacterium]|nr:hypothetical protein [Candidatus Coatesbacteria bacterium]
MFFVGLLFYSLSINLHSEIFPDLDGSFSWAKGFSDTTTINWLVTCEVIPIIFENPTNKMNLRFAVRSFVEDDPKGVIWQPNFLQYDIEIKASHRLNKTTLFSGIWHQCRHNVDRWDLTTESWEYYYICINQELSFIVLSSMWGAYGGNHKASRNWSLYSQIYSNIPIFKKSKIFLRPSYTVEVTSAYERNNLSHLQELSISYIPEKMELGLFGSYNSKFELHDCDSRKTKYGLLGLRFKKGSNLFF